MYSLSIDYLFNRVYDMLLWIKYVSLFVILRNDPKQYLADHEYRVWDGLRDRGWLDYAKETDVSTVVPTVDTHMTFIEKVLHFFGWKLPDSDGDGIPDVSDTSPYDPNNLTPAELKERFEPDYTFLDHIRDIFGFGPTDSDKDGVPDSYEVKHNLDIHSPDSDHDGLLDGTEISIGANPLNNDTDRDGVIDGRDEDPLDATVSAKTLDTDGDGVSDEVEKILKTDIESKDTDHDGIPDGMDTYPTDPSNLGTVSGGDISSVTDGLHLAIQNPVLGFITDLYSVVAIFGCIVLAYVVMRWFMVFWESQMHYEHAFVGGHDDHGHGGASSSISHTQGHVSPIPGLAVSEGPISPPTIKEFEKHPKWAIVEGYMSSSEEPLWRIGILEADNMLAEALREKGYQGEDVGEMLKSANFNSLQLAWEAHKVRNRIAHEGVTFVLTGHEARKTFLLYEAVFKELKMI